MRVAVTIFAAFGFLLIVGNRGSAQELDAALSHLEAADAALAKASEVRESKLRLAPDLDARFREARRRVGEVSETADWLRERSESGMGWLWGILGLFGGPLALLGGVKGYQRLHPRTPSGPRGGHVEPTEHKAAPPPEANVGDNGRAPSGRMVGVRA